MLDPALTRAGRLEHMIQVDLPDGRGRQEIFDYYVGKVAHEPLDIPSLVTRTHGITPAAIRSAIMRGAPRIAMSEDRGSITQHDIERSLIESQVGLANPIGDMPREQAWQVAVHEAGHAVATWKLRTDQRLGFVSTVRRGSGMLGFMLPVGKESTYSLPLVTIVKAIRVSLAGDVATRVVLGERWTGAGSDLEHVRGYVLFLARHGIFGGMMIDDRPSKTVQDRIDKFMDEQWQETEILMQANQLAVKRLADALVERGELTGAEAVEILEAE